MKGPAGTLRSEEWRPSIPQAFAGWTKLEGQSEVAIRMEGLDGESSTRRFAVSPDGDQDGLPDEWETRYFGTLETYAEGDPDGDGITNREEYVLGTDPSDRSSIATRLQISEEGGDALSLTWDPQPGRAYRMTGFSGTGEPDRLTFSVDLYSTPGRLFVWPTSDQRNRFYRLEVSVTPWAPQEIVDEP